MHTIKDCENCGKDYMYHESDASMYDKNCQECIYCVFKPKGVNEYALGNLYIMEEHGIGFPHEIELFYGTKAECDRWIKERPIDKWMCTQSANTDGKHDPHILHENDYKDDKEILFMGSLSECIEHQARLVK